MSIHVQRVERSLKYGNLDSEIQFRVPTFNEVLYLIHICSGASEAEFITFTHVINVVLVNNNHLM